MKHRDDLIEEIAREFSAELIRELGEEVVRDIQNENETLNLKVTRSDEEYCSSHDHCDANMVMLRAFRKIMKRVPLFIMSENDVDQELRDEEMEMVNSAWTMASKNGFWLPQEVTIQRPAIHSMAEVKFTPSEAAILLDRALYIDGFISEQGFMLLSDIRDKYFFADKHIYHTIKDLADDYGMTEEYASVHVKWALAVLTTPFGGK